MTTSWWAVAGGLFSTAWLIVALNSSQTIVQWLQRFASDHPDLMSDNRDPRNLTVTNRRTRLPRLHSHRQCRQGSVSPTHWGRVWRVCGQSSRPHSARRLRALSMKRFVRHEWISFATLNIIEERRAARLAQDRTRYRELNAKRRHALHHDHQVWADKLANPSCRRTNPGMPSRISVASEGGGPKSRPRSRLQTGLSCQTIAQN